MQKWLSFTKEHFIHSWRNVFGFITWQQEWHPRANQTESKALIHVPGDVSMFPTSAIERWWMELIKTSLNSKEGKMMDPCCSLPDKTLETMQFPCT